MVLKNLRLKGYLALPLTPTPPTKRESRHPYPFTWKQNGGERGRNEIGLSVNYGFTLFFMWNCSLFYSNVLNPFLIIYLQDCPPSIRQLWKQMWHIAWSYSQIFASTFAIVPQIHKLLRLRTTHTWPISLVSEFSIGRRNQTSYMSSANVNGRVCCWTQRTWSWNIYFSLFFCLICAKKKILFGKFLTNLGLKKHN